ncbi:single-stranded-DNA-specific exonuclease RecJ [Laceyella putida]|uniref:Single-stranded-DNA-specific exonuclease RecJ n=1 Tax=Laceyella putida TaxID=110101 RepID=A0ABW2RIL5_9BACL
MLHAKTRWHKAEIDETLAARLAADCEVDPLIARMLVRRGIADSEAAKRFLKPKLEDLHDPFLLDGMAEAVARIRQALTNKEKILIYGDYDADGVSSTSLLLFVMKTLQAEVDYYIPNRFREGYGINKEALVLAKERGFGLVVSVDTGISAVAEAEAAKELGLDLIITDHHEPPEQLPDAYAVINPKKPGCPYPFKMLAGVGVAFKLATALLGRIPEEWLELVALGTIADLVPLTDENRILAAFGLKRMEQRKLIGLRALLEVAGIEREVTAGHVGFAIGPRINASGRLGSADAAVRLLTTENEEEARRLAEELDEMNRERQELVEEMTQEAIAEVERDKDQHQHVIVIAKKGWNVGVVGIVASRLVEKYYRPVIVLSIDEEKGMAKGSARSIAAFHLYQALAECREWLPHFGGHAMAAGMTLPLENIPALHQKLSQLAQQWLTEEDYVPQTVLEDELSLGQIQLPLIDQIEALAPYGMGNPTPLFALNNLKLSRLQLMGRSNEHVKMIVQDEAHLLEAVAFRAGGMEREIAPYARLHVLGELQVNEWNGKRSPQLIVRDVAIPHLQIFDWRSNRKQLDRFSEMDTDQCLFVCSAGTEDETLLRQSKYKVASWEELERDQWDEAEIKQAKHVVWVQAPPTMSLCKKGLPFFADAERFYLLFGDKEFDDMLVKTPTREEFKKLYRVLAGKEKLSLSKHFSSLARVTGLQKRALSFMIQVFAECGFISIDQDEIKIHRNPNKKPLTESAHYQKQMEREEVFRTLVYSTYLELCQFLVSTIAFTHIGGLANELQRENSSDSRLSATGDPF